MDHPIDTTRSASCKTASLVASIESVFCEEDIDCDISAIRDSISRRDYAEAANNVADLAENNHQLLTVVRALELLDRVAQLPYKMKEVDLSGTIAWVQDGLAILDGDPGQSGSLLDQVERALVTWPGISALEDVPCDIAKELEAVDLGELVWDIGADDCPWPLNLLNLDIEDLRALARAADIDDAGWPANDIRITRIGDIVVVSCGPESWWGTTEEEKAARKDADQIWLISILQGADAVIPEWDLDVRAYNFYTQGGWSNCCSAYTSRDVVLAALRAMTQVAGYREAGVLASALEATQHNNDFEIREAAREALLVAHEQRFIGYASCERADETAEEWGVILDHRDCA